ncbi:hypothetical protein FB45DRAFT_933157, partial [Roridomyces roridus]
MPTTNIIIHGGSGGPGGPGDNRGGSGGTGEGPKVTLKNYNIRRVSFSGNREPSTPRWNADFRAVKLADLILDEEIDKREIWVDDDDPASRVTGTVQRRRKVVARVYRARIFGNRDPMTAVAYGSDDSVFQEAKERALNTQQFRHPLFAQLFGLHHSPGLNVLVYRDGVWALFIRVGLIY